MKAPYSVQGMFFAFALVGLVFLLRLTCPDLSGPGCFADHFVAPMFLPALFVYEFADSAPLLITLEPLILLLYWGIVGFLIGLCFDLTKKDGEVS